MVRSNTATAEEVLLKTETDDRRILIRHPGNPILSRKDWPYAVNTVFNPAATLLKDGTTLVLARCEEYRGHSHLTAARSADGITGWKVDPEPTFTPDLIHFPEELWGVEDPRITYLPELDQYIIAYTAYSRAGPGVSLALTKDFCYFDRLGMVMAPDNKDAAVLPRRIDGRWVLIHRPVGWLGAHMWLSYSDDLRTWGDHKLMLEARQGAWWDANKIGLCCPPIETPRGWLTIYHGVRHTAAGALYRLGLALFDLEKPESCILRGDSWFFGPEEPYELFGDVGYVVFPCGFTVRPDGDTIYIYYGAADSSIALATGKVSDLLGWLDRHGEPPRSY